jgi:hypothetical protein
VNYETYDLLRTVARDIRDDAVQANNGDIGVTAAIKAVGFLIQEVHRGGKGIVVGDGKAFAAELRRLADNVERS